MPTVFRDLSVPDFYINKDGVRTAIGIVTTNVRSESSDYVIVDGDAIIIVDTSGGDVDITLPDVTMMNNYINVKNLGDQKVFLETPGGETIDGQSNFEIAGENESIQVISDGSNWFIIGQYTP